MTHRLLGGERSTKRATAAVLATAVLLASLLWSSGPCRAESVLVGPPGEADYPTIGEAVVAAADGDTITILPGIYVGPDNMGIDLGSRELVIETRDGLGSVTIDCEETGRAFLIAGGQDTTMVIRGLTIKRGSAEYGGGISIENSSCAKITDCRFELCEADVGGGAIYAEEATLLLEGSQISDSKSEVYGGGAYLVGSACRIRDSLFDSCGGGAGYWSNSGGGLCVDGGSCLVIDSEFQNNTASAGGGAQIWHDGDATFTRCTFRHQQANYGGAVHANDATLRMERCLVEDCYARGRGPAVRVLDCSPSISYCTFNRNWNRTSDGATIQLKRGDGTTSTITNCTFTGLYLSNETHGFIKLDEMDALVEQCVFAFCHGGPVATIIGSGTAEFTHCVVFDIAAGDSLPGNAHDNLFTDPYLCNIYNDDLEVCGNSPCLPGGNPWGLSIGALSQGCGECITPVQKMSWGAIKALYR